MVLTDHDHIQITSFDDLKKCSNSNDWFRNAEVKVDHIPVKRIFWNNGRSVTEVFAAFDKDLQKLIDIQIDEAVSSIESQCQHQLNQIAKLKREIKYLHNLSVWDTIVSKMKTWWNK